jgi:hypothetical protein
MFISYSRKDARAKELNALLKETVDNLKGISPIWEDASVWWDEYLPSGQKWWSNILEKIKDSSHFIYMLSSNSLNSPFCKEEHNWAITMERKRIYVKADPSIRENLLPNGISKFQLIGFKENLTRMVDDIIQTVSANSSSPNLPPNYIKIPYPECPPYKLSSLAERVYNFNENEDGEFVLYNLWRYIRDEDKRDEIVFLANMLKDKVQLKQYHDDIEEILKTNQPNNDDVKEIITDNINVIIPDIPMPTKIDTPISTLPDDIKDVIRLAYTQSIQSTQDFMDLWSSFRDCFESTEISLSLLVTKLSLDSEYENINSLVTELVENPKFLLNFISSVNDIVPEFGICLYNSCKQFIGQMMLAT